MSDMKDFLRDLGYFGVGAAAVIVETGAKAVKALVRKGEKTLTDNQDTVDELKRRAKEAGERIKEAMEKAAAPAEPEVSTPDEPVTPDVIYRTDEPVPEEVPDVEEPTAEEPVIEDPIVDIPVVEEPIPQPESELLAEEEKPEETING